MCHTKPTSITLEVPPLLHRGSCSRPLIRSLLMVQVTDARYTVAIFLKNYLFKKAFLESDASNRSQVNHILQKVAHPIGAKICFILATFVAGATCRHNWKLAHPIGAKVAFRVGNICNWRSPNSITSIGYLK